MSERPAGCPSSSIDLWSDAVLADPYPVYTKLRDTGPVVWLEEHGVAALPRYEETAAALSDWRHFSSAQGVGIDETINGSMGESVITSDPPLHDGYRKPLADQLSPGALAGEKSLIARMAVRFAEAAVGAGRFDAVGDLARPYSLAVVSELVGLPEGRRDMYPPLAERGFNLFGPVNPRTMDGFAALGEMLQDAFSAFEDGWLVPGRRGDALCRMGMPLSLVSYTFPGIDTTVNALGTALVLFAMHPEQWDAIRADRSLIPPAFNEVLRLHAPVHYFTRLVTEDVGIGGVTLTAGTRALIMYGSANRDERRYPDPDRFDIHRPPGGHLGFGRGVHLCVGVHLARIEAHALFEALADRVARFELAGEPRWMLNNTLHGYETAPVRAVPT
jgi:cytochrome P450